MCMECTRFSQTMASEWQTAFDVSRKFHGVPCSLPSKITTKDLKNCKTFSTRPRPRPNVQDQDQDFMIQDQDQDCYFCPRGASRPRRWSRGLHHCVKHWQFIDDGWWAGYFFICCCTVQYCWKRMRDTVILRLLFSYVATPLLGHSKR